MARLSPSNDRPRAASSAVAVAQAVEEWVRAGGVAPGESLPSAVVLAEQFGCSPHTVRRAMRLLADRGLVGGVQGRPPIVLAGARTAGRTRSEQVALELTARIQSGELPAGVRVPSEVDLAAELGVARSTAREALRRLERDGAVVRRSALRYVTGSADADLAYEAVAAALRERVRGGRGGTDRLPGESQLAAEYRVTRPTIRRTLGLLSDEGLVYAVPKTGWFIARGRPSPRRGRS